MQILCATDFSPSAIQAADVAAALAGKFNLPLRLFHCGQDWLVAGELPVVGPVDPQAQLKLEAEAQRLKTAGIDVLTEFCDSGGASWEIITAAAKQATRLIVLGSAGADTAERWLAGSVALRVAEGASAPTLIVRDAAPLLSWIRESQPLPLLCAVNFTVSADAALDTVRQLEAVGPLAIDAAYVDGEHQQATTSTTQQRDVWERLHAVLGDMPIKVHVRDTDLPPAAEFVRLAGELKPGLLVVGSRQRHGWQRLKGPSFSHHTLAHAPTNVLCVPVGSYHPPFRIPAIHRLLLATDLGEHTQDALRHACSLLPAGGEMRLVHVCYEPSRGINPVIASELYFDHSLATAKDKEEAEAKISALLPTLLATSGIQTSSEILIHHDASAAICDAAERFGADVICMGTKGHSRTGVALLGSTVQAVLARTHKPVFVVPPPAL